MALRLHWPDERYTRVYCRDTIEWSALSWDAQALYMQLCRKASRRGTIDLGRIGRRGLAVLLGRPDLWPQVIEPALAELEADGCVRVEGTLLVVVDFEASQEAVSSGKARTAKWREHHTGDETSPLGDDTSPGDETSQKVTPGYGTARHGTGGTEGTAPGANGAAPTTTLPPAPPPGPALSQAFEEDLDAEATKEEKAQARVLDALGEGWSTIADLSGVLHRGPDFISKQLNDLKNRGLAEWAWRSKPGKAPIAHWRKVGALSAYQRPSGTASAPTTGAPAEAKPA